MLVTIKSQSTPRLRLLVNVDKGTLELAGKIFLERQDERGIWRRKEYPAEEFRSILAAADIEEPEARMQIEDAVEEIPEDIL